jgi:hypothetical protein
MCLHHHGVGNHLPDAVAVKVRATTPQPVVHTMARQIDPLALDRAPLRRMSRPTLLQRLNKGMTGPAQDHLYRQVSARRCLNTQIGFLYSQTVPRSFAQPSNVTMKGCR